MKENINNEQTNNEQSNNEQPSHKQSNHKIWLLIPFLFLVFAIPVLFLIITYTQSAAVTITISAPDTEILQDEEIPDFFPDIAISGKKSLMLDKKKKYTVKSLEKDLKNGGVTVSCETDSTLEGEYPITVTVQPEIEKKIKTEWSNHLKLIIQSARLTVKNKYGSFDGGLFFSPDGEPVSNQFVVVEGKTYYIDENGEKTTGWKTIENKTFHFDADGLITKGWYEENGETYYLKEDGTLAAGWLTAGENKYYAGKNGAVIKGDYSEGIVLYHFDPDTGAYLSEETKIDPSRPMLALTFDDGPGEDTLRLLEALEKYKVHATFFMCGTSLSRTDIDINAILTKMDEIGCDTSNHTMTHPTLDTLSVQEVQSQVNGVNNIISGYLGHGARALRPPYGRGIHSETVTKNVNLPMIYWSIDTLDWKTKDKDATVQAILEQSSDGDIVLLHDIHQWSVDAAIEAIPQLIDAGYQLVTISELAAARNITLENGVTYFNFYP